MGKVSAAKKAAEEEPSTVGKVSSAKKTTNVAKEKEPTESVAADEVRNVPCLYILSCKKNTDNSFFFSVVFFF